MGFFSKILAKLGIGQAQAAPAPEPAPAAAPVSTAPVAPPAPTPIAMVDVVAQLEQRAAANPQKLNWRTSIVDLLKLLGLDSSLAARKQLAGELLYSGNDEPGSAAWNIWLHKQVMRSIAANGGTLPPELRD